MSEGEITGQDKFAQDIATNKGYSYSTNAQLSCQMANQRMTDVSLQMLNCAGERVLDIGCGDGTYTVIFFDHAKPAEILGVDAVLPAVEMAAQKVGNRAIKFQACSIYELSRLGQHFDAGYIRGVLHHLDNAELAIKESLCAVDRMIIIEPNGYNIGLKFIEKLSKYHREHAEKSYFPMQLDAWIKKGNGQIVGRRWAGFVPIFCPDWMARIFKWLEPIVENTPIMNRLMCAVYYVVVEKVKQ